MSVPPPAPGGQQPVGQPDPYGPPPGGHPQQPQQQYGQPPQGQPGQFGPPPGQYGPPPGQPGFPPVPKKSKARFIGLGVGIIVVIAVVVVGIISFTKSPASSNVGDCLTITEFTSGGDDPVKAECGDAKANVKIAAKLDSASEDCPGGTGGGYDTYSVSGRSSYKLCLMINAKQGDCLANFTSKTQGYMKVPCTDPTKDGELVKVVDGQADKNLCEGTEANYAVAYPKPATTMCVKGSE